MHEGQTLRRATEYFQAFPSAEEVFANRLEEHSEYLLPIAIVDLDRIIPGAHGKLPIAMPIEPAAGWGCVGDRSVEYHNYLCRPNWIGYRVIDGKLELACDFRYFHKEYLQAHPPQDQHGRSEAESIGPHYEKIRREFEQRMLYFREHGVVRWSEHPYREGFPPPDSAPWMGNGAEYVFLSLVGDLGGQSVETNWTGGFPIAIRSQPKKEENPFKLPPIFKKHKISIEVVEIGAGLPVAVPLTEDGREFVYVGCFELGTYLNEADGGMLAFYDPQDQVLLTTFDWS